jgi:hypothetical protein
VNVEYNTQVLLTAELIAEVYFGNLYLRVPDATVKQVTRKLLADEMKHLVFQRQFLSERLRSLSPPLRLLWHWQFICVHRITTWVVSWDHADCLRAIGLTPRTFRHRAADAISHFSKKLWQSVEGLDPFEPEPYYPEGSLSRLE